jgi:ABC-type nitrate/sulfonate/bicarbonate transport system ATPase subunit
MTPFISLENISFEYPGGKKKEPLRVLDGISLTANAGECFCIIGPSGCGKSTLLLIAGELLDPTSGRRIIAPPPPTKSARRSTTILFQDLRLFYWLTAIENIKLVLKSRGITGTAAQEEANAHLARVGLAQYGDYYQHELSGGMAQRLAFARALATEAPAILLDEPFSNLDRLTQSALEDQLISLANKQRKTLLIVTHDVGQAVRLADRVFVLSRRPGRIIAEECIETPRPRQSPSSELTEIEKRICNYMSQ